MLVISHGITGLTAAYRLSRRQDRPRVALVEATHGLGIAGCSAWAEQAVERLSA